METSLIKQFLIELLGTFVLILIGAAVVASLVQYAQSYLLPAIAFGLTFIVLLYLWYNYTVHLNPAFTFASLMDQRITMKDATVMWSAQLIGAVLAALIVLWFYGNSGPALGSISNTEVLKTFLIEFTFSVVFILTFLFTTKSKNWYSPLVIGLALFALMLAAYPLTGASFNPARAFGPAIFSKEAAPLLWVYFLAPMLAAFVAFLIYKCFYYLNFTPENNIEPIVASPVIPVAISVTERKVNTQHILVNPFISVSEQYSPVYNNNLNNFSKEQDSTISSF